MRNALFFLAVLLFSCSEESEKTTPKIQSITESVYASGNVKSKNQYRAFASVSGIVDNIYVQEGDTVKQGQLLLSITSKTQQLNKENARLAYENAKIEANKGKLNEAKKQIEFNKNKMENDSILLERQETLWSQKVGSKVELEQRQLAYENAKNNYYSALVRYRDLKRELELSSTQSRNNLKIVSEQEDDFNVRSMINGIVYSLDIEKGEIITPQTPIATLGDAQEFILEMQVDEYDIVKVKTGLPVIVNLNSYSDKVFNATVTKVYPIMNVKSKTFLVEAKFIDPPKVLYPNITFEANILIQTKKDALLIPRTYMKTDSTVVTAEGKEVIVKTGLKDYQKIEILSGIGQEDELVKP